MANKIKLDPCDTFADFADQISEAVKGWESVWYRGVTDDYDLSPKVFRKSVVKPGFKKNFSNLAETYLNESIDRKLTFFSRDAIHFLDVLCLAQHRKFPTRLLDWSENLSTALYFAIDSPKANPHIWLLNPRRLNSLFAIVRAGRGGTRHASVAIDRLSRASRSPATGIFRTLRIDDDLIDPLNDYAEMCFGVRKEERCFKWPVAFYPKYVNRRLLTQQAGFTIHGMKKDPLEKLIGSLPEEVQRSLLVCVSFTKDFRQKRLNTLRRLAPSPVQIFNDDDAGLFDDILNNELWHRD